MLSSVDGRSDASVEPLDRGLQFGDGLFETIFCLDGVPIELDAHLRRLSHGCEVLGIACPALAEVITESAARQASGRGCIKVVVTRGSTGRGYQYPDSLRPNWYLRANPLPAPQIEAHEHGIDVKICRTVLPTEDPRLAGLKHLNRLHQVMARRELQAEFSEGLLCDSAGHIVEGCASNLFLVLDGQLLTPDLSRGGVLGTFRERVLRHAAHLGARVAVTTISRHDLRRATEVFITNAVRGLLPVRSVDGQRYEVGTITRRLQSDLCQGRYYD